MSKAVSTGTKVVYPPGCKELSEDIGKDELVRRLKALARAFQDMSQEENEQYSGLALTLATEYYMDHSSKDVRLLIACCIADVFRIFAPDAPYKEQSLLKEIFMFLIKQLRGLEDPNTASFKRYFYLLENLAWVKSFNICIELDDNQEIFCSLFKLMFSIVNESHYSKVQNFMLDLMTPLITEADSVSQELLDIILLNIIEPRKSHNKVAYTMAKDLLRRTSNAIEPYIQAFFNNALMLGKTSESEVSEHLFELIYELNNISPNVLLAVLPQLEFKLKSNDESERKSVTRLLAKMFSEPHSELANQNKPLWKCFLGRFNDISITVRTICVQYSQHFILNHPTHVREITEHLKARQHDPEETVRMEVVGCILNAAKKDFLSVSDELLEFIKERTLDKKFKIRREALLGLGALYKRISQREPFDAHFMERVTWIKDKVLHAYYQQSVDDRLLVERVFNTCIVPYTLPSEERMRKLYLLYASLDDYAVKAFNEVLKAQLNVRNCLEQLVDLLDQDLYDEGKAPTLSMINPKLVTLARCLPDSVKALERLKKFSNTMWEDQRIRQVVKILCSPECTCKKAEDAVKEVLKKVGNPNPQNVYYTTVKALLERTAPVMIDKMAIQMVVHHVSDVVVGISDMAEGIPKAGEKGMQLLLALSWAFPKHFDADEVFGQLIVFLKNEDDIIVDLTLQIFANTGHNLQERFPAVFSSLLPVLQSLAKLGTPKQAKHAIRCIGVICENKEAALTQVFEHIKKSLNPDSANYLTSIVALGHIAQLCPQEFASDIKSIVSKVIVKELLMQDRTEGPMTSESWYSDHRVTEETQSKIQALKMLVRWLQGLKSNATNSGSSTLRLLHNVIIHDGDLMEHGKINKPELARLRLEAGCCMLKMAEEPAYAEIVTREQFQTMALLINDSCYEVRLRFAQKLNKGLLSLRLPLEYMSIFSLAANDPLKERRVQVKSFLAANIQKRREYLRQNPSAGAKMFSLLPDYVLPYTVHLLAHDPDLKTHDHLEALTNIKDCLWFILEPLMTKNDDYNYNFYRRMLQNIKQTKDVQGPDDEEMNKKLYAVCDLALGLVLTKTTSFVLKESKAEPLLPSKLFAKPDKDFSNTDSYLPKEFQFDAPKVQKEIIEGLIPSAPQRLSKIYKPVTQGTTTTIIVESPKPVINLTARTPKKKDLEEKLKAERKEKREKEREEKERAKREMKEKKAQNKGKRRAAQDSASNTEGESSPEKPPPKQGSGKRAKTITVKKKGDAPFMKPIKGKGSPVKSPITQKQLKVTRSKASPRSPSKSIRVNFKKASPLKRGRGRPAGRANSAGPSPSVSSASSQSSSPKKSTVNGKKTGKSTQESVTATRKRAAEESPESSPGKRSRTSDTSVDSSPVKRQRGAAHTGSRKVTRAELAKQSESSDNQNSETSETESSQNSRPSSRLRSAPPPSPASKTVKPTRSTSKESRQASDSPSPTASRKKQTKITDILPKKTAVTRRNVRRAGTLSNGTSDGDDVQTPETDSQESPDKAEALSRAIQAAGEDNSEQETIVIRRRNRRK
ncbi:sister chromatid cohesion protein PDS5 homolog B-like [Liolophura sinensis]|uniref:sister chromatid cohesion protein PDS5 homolog B-like n=1 Tax=Liolophura sinensis TaxID=3198878 RepID=UPI003159743C